MTLTLNRAGTGRKNVTPVGLDIGPFCLRAAQLERGAAGWRVARVNQWLRRESEVGAPIVPGFARRIARTLEQSGYRGRRTCAGLSIPEVELHALEIPDQGDLRDARRFGEAVRWEMERVSGVSAAEAASGYWRVPPSSATRTSAIGVLAPTKHVDEAQSIARAVGLDCRRVDATACALARLGVICRRSEGRDDQEVWSVLDAGHRMLRLIVSAGGVPVLVRHLGKGSHGWTESIAETLGLSTDAAEVHKRDHGIAGVSSRDADDASAEIAAMIYNIIRTELDLLAEEVERSYEYVMRCYSDHPAGSMLLVGGGADLKGLDRHLARSLGIEVRCLDDVVRNPKAPGLTCGPIRDSLNPYGAAIGLTIEEEQGS